MFRTFYSFHADSKGWLDRKQYARGFTCLYLKDCAINTLRVPGTFVLFGRRTVLLHPPSHTPPHIFFLLRSVVYIRFYWKIQQFDRPGTSLVYFYWVSGRSFFFSSLPRGYKHPRSYATMVKEWGSVGNVLVMFKNWYGFGNNWSCPFFDYFR